MHLDHKTIQCPHIITMHTLYLHKTTVANTSPVAECYIETESIKKERKLISNYGDVMQEGRYWRGGGAAGGGGKKSVEC